MSLAGFFAPLAVYAVVTALHRVIPGRTVDGYVIDPATGKPLRYRLNGLETYAATLGIWALLCSLGLLPWDFFWTTRWEGLAGACVLGLVFTAWIVLPAPRRGGLLADLYLGRLENPRWSGGRVDAKMWLYLVGATMLGLHIDSFAAHHLIAFPTDPSPGVSLYLALFTFFLCEYLFFERVHLYTYDFFAERVGFKLGWGCLCFYPNFYAIGLWSVAAMPNPRVPAWALAAAAIVFFLGWSLARGANMQKFAFKLNPRARFLGIEPVAIGDGERQLLVSGFWRLSRHVNYLGELLMATGLTLALGRPGAWTAWLYPLYYVALLVPRQMDDDKRCAAKYGPLWKRYCEKVRYRIVPGVY